MLDQSIIQTTNGQYDNFFHTAKNKKCYPHVCLVCDTFIKPSKLKLITIEDLKRHENLLTAKDFTRLHDDSKKHYTISAMRNKNIEPLKYFSLSPRAVFIENTKQSKKWIHNLCILSYMFTKTKNAHLCNSEQFLFWNTAPMLVGSS